MNGELWRRSCDILAEAPRIDLAGARQDDSLFKAVVCSVWWSILLEPGDAAFGFVESVCGRQAALAALFSSQSAKDFVSRIRGAAQPAGPPATDEEVRVLCAAWSRWRPRVEFAAFRRAITTADSMRMGIVHPEGRWPTALDVLGAHRPACLWVRGEVTCLAVASEQSVAIVGARAATGYGEHCAMELSGGMARRGITVVSGGAYGIDGAAHRAALAMDGPTIAVLAGGADRLYPSGHDQLLRKIIDRGAVVSETAPGVAPTRWRFLQRNRVIASLASATIVVEAGSRSGSLNTAHHALSVGRPLGAVPGPITSSSSRGCHALIRDSAAVCVTSIEDVLELLGHTEDGYLFDAKVVDESRDAGRSGSGDLSASTRPSHSRIFDALHPRHPRSVTELARLTGMAPGSVMAVIGDLDAEGLASTKDGGWVKSA